jgi:hypothetical protein
VTYEGAMGTPPPDVLADNTATVRVRAQAWLEHQLQPDRPSGTVTFDGAALA